MATLDRLARRSRRDARRPALAFDLKRLEPRFLERSLSALPRAARARPGPPHARRLLFPHALRGLRRGLSRQRDLELRQDGRFPPEFRRRACSMSITRRASSSTILPITRACAGCWRRPSRRARSKALQARVEALVDRLLDAIAARGRCDLIEDFASAIPVQLIGDMLGVPQQERGPLRGWSLAILGALEPVLSPAMQPRARHRRRGGVQAYLADLVAERLQGRRRSRARVLSTPDQGQRLAGRRRQERLSETRAAAQLHLPAERRPRDHDQPDRQRRSICCCAFPRR